MKIKQVIKSIILILLVSFTVLYVSQAFGYYEYSNYKSNSLTEEAKEKFEQDIKSGKNIKASDYIKRENDYNNNLSKSGLFISKTIDDVFSNVMAFVFNEINKTVNS